MAESSNDPSNGSRPSVDHAAVVDLVGRYQDAFNTNDAPAMNALFDDDSVFVNIVGNLVLGREPLYRAQAFVFDGPLREVYVRYDVESLIFLHADIAVVHARQRPASADGRLVTVDAENRESIVVFVAVRTPAGWRIRVGQNTVVG